MSLKSDLVRLAHEKPELRHHLLPLLQKRATYDTEAKKLADLLGSKFRGVKFDAKKDHGTAGLGYFKISFRSSSNDPAVIVEFDKVDRIKGDADMIMDALKDMQAALNI